MLATTGLNHATRIAIDGGHVDVDTVGNQTDLTITLHGRATLGLSFTTEEATRIGEALNAAGKAVAR